MTDPRVERTRRHIHDAVIALLREDGLRSVTHTNVATTAGVGRATVYRHFPDRTSLLVSTLQTLRPELDLPPRTGDPRVDARTLVGVVAEHLNDNPMAVDMLVLLRDAEEDPDLAVARMHVFPLRGNPALDLVVEAQAAGTIDPQLDPIATTAALMGPVIAARVLLRMDLTEQLLDDMVSVWVDGAVVSP